MERCFPACKYDKKVSPITGSERYWHTKKFAMEYVNVFEFTADIRGYHYYKKFWKPESHQVLNCYHEKNNALDRFPIMVSEKLLQKLYTEPKDEDILSSFLQVETTGTDALQKSRELYLNQKRGKISLKSKQKTFGICLKATVNKQHIICLKEPTRIKHQKKKL